MQLASGVTYIGDWVKGNYHADASTFEGELENDLPNGRETYKFSDGSVFTGLYRDGMKHGEGVNIWPATGTKGSSNTALLRL
jgi:hypothetical protein